MKKFIIRSLFLSVLLIIFANGYTQGLQYGIKGGVSAYQLESYRKIIRDQDATTATSDPRFGFEAGIFFDFRLTSNLSIQPEFLFVQKGGKTDYSKSSSLHSILNYLDLPLLLKIQIPLNVKIHPYIFGGPYTGYLLKVTGENSSERSDYFKTFNYGLKTGIGINFGRMIIDARYDLGLTNIFDEKSYPNELIGSLDLNLFGIVLSIGIIF